MDDIPGADDMANMADMDNMDAAKNLQGFLYGLKLIWKTEKQKTIIRIIRGFGRIAAVYQEEKKTDIEK